jgi:hypothetical protein
VLQTHLARSTLGKGFHRSINEHHHTIVEAIEAGDADRAASEMYAHLVFLRPAYERAWRHAAAMRKRVIVARSRPMGGSFAGVRVLVTEMFGRRAVGTRSGWTTWRRGVSQGEDLFLPVTRPA